jgi:predicted  nucleic acid-binding Zn-ribbon protein
MPPPRPKALSGINGEELVRSTSSETVHHSMNDLLEERRRFEQYTRDQNARLSRLRALINEEKAAASADLEKRRAEIVAAGTDKLKAELDEARELWQEQEKALAKTQAEYHAAQEEIQRLRDQHARQEVQQANLRHRCQLYESAANETAQLREQVQQLKEENLRCKLAADGVKGLQNERDLARAEADMLRQREAARIPELEELRTRAAAQAKMFEEQRNAIAEKAQELYRLARSEDRPKSATS